MFLGKQVHDALEVFYRHRQLGVDLPIETVLRRISDRWESATEAEGMQFDSLDAEAKTR